MEFSTTTINKNIKLSNYVTCLEKCKNTFFYLDCISASEACNDQSVPLLPWATRLWGYILHLEERAKNGILSHHSAHYAKAAHPLSSQAPFLHKQI